MRRLGKGSTCEMGYRLRDVTLIDGCAWHFVWNRALWVVR